MDYIFVVYILLGVAIGTLGTLVGAGGGFILLPILLWRYPQSPPTQIAAISMLAVCANALSGSLAYGYRRQIHWVSALLFSLFAIPGIYFGINLGRHLDRKQFEFIFGVILIILSLFLVFRKKSKDSSNPKAFTLTKVNYALGGFISLAVGVMASFLGIGGGIIHVPLLSEILKFPIHLATGTSHFILAFTALVAVVDHFFNNQYHQMDPNIFFLILGLLSGAQLGAALSRRISGKSILFMLSFILFLVGLKLLLKSAYVH